jgi:hypothetical protein
MADLWNPTDLEDPRVAVIFDDILPEGWEVWIFLDNEAGHPIVHEVRLAPSRAGSPYRKAPDGGLQSRYRGLLNIDELRLRAYQEVVDNLADVGRRPGWQEEAAVWDTIRAAESALANSLRSGRQRRTPEFYAHVAASYVRQASKTRRVYDAMHKLDFPSYSLDTLRDLVKECRQKGYLTSAPSGRAGGQLTEEALALLDEVAVNQ